MSLYSFKQKAKQSNDSLGLRFFTKPGELLLDNIVDEKTTGGSAKLIWNQSIHTAVLGAEFYRGDLDQTLNAGKILRIRGVPASDSSHPDDEQLAVYANDTIVINRWSFTPGIRYDKNHTTGSFTSPSMGVTYNPGEDTTLRALVARGFTSPPLLSTSGGGVFTEPNRSLKPESVWSYQMGIETRAFTGLWLKATIFRHDQKNSLSRERVAKGPFFSNYRIINKSKIRRTGIEVSANTIAVHNFSFLGGFSYVHLDPALESGISRLYSYAIGIRYDDKNSLKALLSGNYTWWNVDSSFKASYNDFIWDFFLTKKICSAGKASSEIFFAVHNIFNSSQYNNINSKNPDRWLEAGIRLSF
jgi:vitamin B12 transporter